LFTGADCCAKIGLVVPADLPALGTKVFPAYLALVHKLQKTYWLGACLRTHPELQWLCRVVSLASTCTLERCL